MKRTRSHASHSRRIAAMSCTAALSLLASRAAANGRYPAAGLIVVDPANESRILVRSTYGILVTNDGGAPWRWICELGVGYKGVEDPMIGLTADGSLLAGLFEGLSRSPGDPCVWSYAGGDIAGRYAIDLSVEPGNRARALVLTSNGLGGGAFLTRVWETADNGVTLAQLGSDLSTDLLGLAIDAAPSDPDTLYVTGRLGAPDYPPVVARSADRGKTWEVVPIAVTGAAKRLPYLSAVDPSDPARIYVRLDGEPSDALIVSNDGGTTFQNVLEAKSSLLGFALSPDGSTVLAGGPKDGLWSAPASTLAFERIGTFQVQCLTWTKAGVYACADEFKDGFTAGLSIDQGASFTPILHLHDPCPLACGADTPVGQQCPIQWPVIAELISAKCDEPTASGSSGTSGSTGSAGGAAPSGSTCGCRAAGRGSETPAGAWAGSALALAVLLRRLRRRAPPASRRVVEPARPARPCRKPEVS